MAEPGGISGWVIGVIESIGEAGVGALIALETIVPPIPSEVVLPFAGFSAARGDINLVLAWVAATVGSLVGAFALYWVGAKVGYEGAHRLAAKKWFILFSRADLERGEKFFDRHGDKVVLIGRFIPFIRSVVSVPAGFDRMPVQRFALLTGIGSGIWNAAFLLLGYRLGDRWEDVEQYVRPVSTVVVGLVVVGLIWLAVRRVRHHRGSGAKGVGRRSP